MIRSEQDEDANVIVERRDEVIPLKIAALKEFFAKPYWQRLWIVQEIMLAKYVRIICGETLLSWDELRRFCSSGRISPFMEARRLVPPQVIWLVEYALSAKLYSFSSLLRVFGRSKCQDPRDKVYGLQGMLQEQHRMEIDYAKSVYEVFYDAAIIMAKDRITSRTDPEVCGYWSPFTTTKMDIVNQFRFKKPAEGIFERAVLAMVDIVKRLHYVTPIETVSELELLTMTSIVDQFNYGRPVERIFEQAVLAVMNIFKKFDHREPVEGIFEQVALAMMNVVNQLNYGKPVEGIFEQAAMAMMNELNNAIEAYPMTISTNLGNQMCLGGSIEPPDFVPYQNSVTTSWRNVSSEYVKMHFKKIGDDSGVSMRTLDDTFGMLCKAYDDLLYRFERSFELLMRCSTSIGIKHVSSFLCSKIQD
ncbi:MAG: hypothetical protein M1821_002360 [Bathelium mastoideum]|nr:MAG: hypothetical protein M1821_002360 [Bathelium mastoideum]